ncbi:hypothetical protein [Ruegeria atlantica]|uniref:hypothetical protein n=1 Tax=Ruegeria atlantica TaxID=81569 RepID=UPI002494E275|nr:hypothetical protein [Ruegeria atlantica]
MPEANTDRNYDYDSKYLADILKSFKTIAKVSASADNTKLSYGVPLWATQLDKTASSAAPAGRTTIFE